MDVVFVSEVNMLHEEQHMPHIGHLILRDILSERYECVVLNNQLLEEKGILDQGCSAGQKTEVFARYIASFVPKIVDFYTICDTFPVTILLAQKLKKYAPQATVVFGGPQASLLAKVCLQLLDCVDIVAYSEGENVVERLVDSIIEQRDLKAVPGIAYRSGKQIQFTGYPEFIPAEQLHRYFVRDFAPYTIPKGGEIRLEGGRGCPFHCTFCSTSLFWRQKARLKPVEHLLKEMQYYQEKYHIRKFGILHDLFTSNRNYILKFCDMILQELPGIEWTCSARLDTMDSQLLERLASAHCTALYVGIEAGSERMQKLLNKNLELSALIPFAELCKKYKIDVTYSFIIGFPDETLEDFNGTVELVEQLLLLNVPGNMIQVHMFSPYPVTEETEKIKEQLYFPQDKSYLPITQKACLCPEVEQIIRTFPQLSTSYLDFKTEVRSKYRAFPSLMELIESTKNIFTFTLLMIISHRGLCVIYEKYAQYFWNIMEMEQSCQDVDMYNKRGISIMKKVLNSFVAEMNVEERELFEMEKLLGDIVIAEEKKYYFCKSSLDLKRARQYLKIKRGKKRYLFFGGNLQGEILEIKDEIYGHRVEETLKKSFYTNLEET